MRIIRDIGGAIMVWVGILILSVARTMEDAMRENPKDDVPRQPKPPNARKAAKRARKAAKNLEMYKTAGDRPWLHSFIAGTADSLRHRLHASDYSEDDDDCNELRANVRSRHMFRMQSLREPSGFKQMSAIAGYFQTHDVTDVLNCGHCGGRGKWKDDEKGPTMCLRCKGKGRVIFCKPQWIKYVPSADRFEG